jgi:two-component system, OmpR family, sensor histidine kinase SenX3
VNAATAAAVALVAGLVVGAFIVWLLMRRPVADPVDHLPDAAIEAPEGVAQLLQVLGSPALVVGPGDDVLEASPQARTIGMVRGDRIVVGELLDLVRRARRERLARNVDLEIRRGNSRAAISLAVRIALLQGELILVLAEDRTQARRVEETRRDFVANVSHELKTPIGAVALLAEAMENAADDPDAVHRFAGRLGLESQRLSDLVGQIIDLSRVQAHDPMLQAETVEVDEVLSRAVDRCRVDAEKRSVQLTVAPPTGCRLRGSTQQLVAAVGNLVENAIIYSDAGARVAVAAHRVVRGEDEIIEITVSDNGIGIAPDDVARIFERFYRVDYARSRSNGGTGLGLSIVKHIAAAHGGEVTVWSQLGQGSTFTISIPATRDQQPAPAADRPVARASAPELGGPGATTGPWQEQPTGEDQPAEQHHRRSPRPTQSRNPEAQETLR